jgi:hypothetical protein
MRRLRFGFLLFACLAGLAPRPAEAMAVSIELRHTPMRVRPKDLPSLCPMLALSPLAHLWIGAGYELIQDYDAVLWTSEYEGRKPIAMSGLRAGAWYRGGDSRDGLTFAAGALLTYANPATSSGATPRGIDSGTSIIDFGADISIGRVWQHFRLELFATPAWSYGHVSSPAVHKKERFSAFTYRFGGAIAFLFGS